jgi:hypothetical protein
VLKGPAVNPQKEQRSASFSSLELTFDNRYGGPGELSAGC